MKGSFSYKVLSQEVDFQKRQTLAAFGTALLESAARNADANGFGLRLLQQNQTTWVLNKMVIDFSRILSDGQFYKVETWVGDVNRLATTRYFRVVDADERPVAEVYSNWVMLDMNTRRPVNLEEVKGLAQAVEQEKLMIDRPVRILSVDEPPVFLLQAKYSDIDINGHVNSMRYVQWMSDLFSRDFYERHSLKRFEINYANEVKWGDDFAICKVKVADNDFHIEIKSEDKSYCKARMLFT
ncbi:MAG: hypothetical protein IKR52_07095 [Paludibacteraceae bacterium]|nr:hypothetical protein [Paludibacteraceae bacterium]MBR6310944.1 hypothetical protein [Paludibacteraceae bacterium]